jgi:hypothetical protein
VEVCSGIEPKPDSALPIANAVDEDISVEIMRFSGLVSQKLKVHLVVLRGLLGRKLQEVHKSKENIYWSI